MYKGFRMILIAFFLIVIGAACKSPEMVAVGFIIGIIRCLMYFVEKVHRQGITIEY